MKFLFFLAFVAVPVISDPLVPFDFVEDALLKYRNLTVDPCNNFYRHACSFNSPDYVTEAAFEEINQYIKDIQKDEWYNLLRLMSDHEGVLKKFDSVKGEDAIISFYTKAIRQICEKDLETASTVSRDIIETIAFEIKRKESDEKFEARKRQESDCDSLVESTEKFILEIIDDASVKTLKTIEYFFNQVSQFVYLSGAIAAHLDIDVRKGIENTRDMMLTMMKIAEGLIKDTPWVQKQQLVEKIEEITSKLSIHDNYGKDSQTITNALISAETYYIDCQWKYSYVENNELLCYFLTAGTQKFPEVEFGFFPDDNAVNNHPSLYFGFPNYYYAQYGKEMASKLGYVGFTVGHEIGHTFFDNHHTIIPAFSKKAEDCVQTQYNSTCTEFREMSCTTTPDFLDENGADIFGLQLAYELMKKYYGFGIDKKVERLGVTYEQLFFYSYAYQFCSKTPSSVTKRENGSYDPHSALNVRVNVAAQHPAFKQAFSCFPESRMMKSATEQCLFYGVSAPDVKKRRRFDRVLFD